MTPAATPPARDVVNAAIAQPNCNISNMPPSGKNHLLNATQMQIATVMIKIVYAASFIWFIASLKFDSTSTAYQADVFETRKILVKPPARQNIQAYAPVLRP